MFGALFKKIGMMLFTVLVPEAVLLKAIGEFTSALALTETFQQIAKADGSPWSHVHTFFANMGGFVIHFTPETPPSSFTKKSKPFALTGSAIIPSDSNAMVELVDKPAIDRIPDLEQGLTQSLSKDISVLPKLSARDAKESSRKKSKMTARDRALVRIVDFTMRELPKSSGSNGTMVREIVTDIQTKLHTGEDTGFESFILDDIVLNLARLRDYDWALDVPQLMLARKMGIIDRVPNVSKAEIEDKGNSDFLIKFLAVVQVTWQIIQLIIRWKRGLPSSQIEVATVGFSLCAFIMYLAYWSKPQDVATPYLVQARRYPTKEEIFQLAQRGPALDGIYTGMQYSIPEHAIHLDLTAIEGKHLDGGIIGWSGVTIGGVLFGLMHCVAWNFNFPTPVERLLWRIASIITTTLPIFHFARAMCWVAFARWEKEGTKHFIGENTFSSTNRGVRFFGVVGLISYFVSRVYLVVETFRSLLYLLPDTFQTTT